VTSHRSNHQPKLVEPSVSCARERERERKSREREREKSDCALLACIVTLSVCARAVVRVESVGGLQVEVES
jgi:hypothetical protein